MELEEMKTLWTEMSATIEKQKQLTDSIIIKMTKADYSKKINRILIPEVIGSLICVALVVYILFNFQQLGIWYLQVCGVVTLLLLVLMPVLSIAAIYKMRSVNISGNNYKKSLLEYSKRRLQFVFTQKLSFYLSAVLLLADFPVMSRLLAGKDVFKTTPLWFFYAVAFPIFYWFAKWVFKSYLKITKDAEGILKELEA